MSVDLDIQKAVKRYKDFYAVNEVDLFVNKGEFFTLLGPSGCGKTTLLRMIAGFNSIDGGEIYFNGALINNVVPHKRNIGMVFQNYAIFPHLTVGQNVAYGLKERKLPKDKIARRVKEGLAMVKMEQYQDRQPSNLSGGQQQRIALARAIVVQPDILLMDEPLSNLDAKLRVEMRTVIRRLQKDLGITTIYVTHDQEEALAVSDRIAVMKDGKVQQVGTPEEIYTKPANQFVANFIGTSSFIKGQLEQGNGKPVLAINRYRTHVPVQDAYTGEVKVSVRPGDFSLSETGEGIEGEVAARTFLGESTLYFIKLEDGSEIEVKDFRQGGHALHEEGQRIKLAFNPRTANLFYPEGDRRLV